MGQQNKPQLVIREGESRSKEKEKESKRKRNTKYLLRKYNSEGESPSQGTKKPELIKRLTTQQREAKSKLKGKHHLAAPKKSANIPNYLRPYIDLWREYGGTKHLDEYTKTFKKGIRLLTKLINGKAFDISTFKHEWAGHKFTYDDFKLSLTRLHLAITDEYYHPRDKSNLRNISLDNFILNCYGKNGDISLFLLFLNNPPRRLFTEKDPKLTKLLISHYRENMLGGVTYDPSLTSKDKFVKASNRLKDFFDINRKHVSIGFQLDRSRIVRWLFEAIQRSINGFEDSTITPGHLCSDLTFNERLPAFLIDQAIFSDRHTSV